MLQFAASCVAYPARLRFIANAHVQNLISFLTEKFGVLAVRYKLSFDFFLTKNWVKFVFLENRKNVDFGRKKINFRNLISI